MRLRSALALVLVVGGMAATAAGETPEVLVVETLAGTGEAGYSGDGGPAVDARLDEPSGVAVDGAGNVYIADNDNHRIRRVDREGRISTIAGTGEAGFSGDGGPATAARLNNPYGVWVSGAGEIYIADQRNHRVRVVSREGTIRTIAGNGVQAYSGDGGPALEASLAFPDDVVMNSKGELFIADAGNDVVRRVRSDGTIDTWAGSGEHFYDGASGFSGDGGPARQALLDTPAALAINSRDDLFIADLRNHAVRKVDADGIISTVAGTGRRGFNGDRRDATKAMLDEPGGLAVEADGSLLIAEGGNWRVRRLAPDGSITTIAGSGIEGFGGDRGDARLARFSTLDFVAVGGQGRIYVADYGNDAVRVLRPGRPEPASAVDWLLLRMRDAYAAVDHVRLATRERLVRRDPGARDGTVELWADGRVRARFSIPDYGEVAVDSDGFKITVTDPKRPGPPARRHDAGNLNRALLGNLEVYSFYDAFRQLSTGRGGFMAGSRLSVLTDQSWNGRSWTVLQEEAAGLRILYYVDPESHLIWRTVHRDAASDAIVYESSLSGVEL